MFGKRPDGRKLHNVEAIQLITTYLMTKRYDAMNMFEDSIDCEPWDKYIKEKAAEGIKLNYMQIFIACIVRTIALWPRLNRFVMNGKLYARHKIWASFTIHPEMSIEKPDTTIKICFEGTETVFEIADKITEAINRETVHKTDDNGADKLIGVLTSMPSFILNIVASLLKWMDRHNMLPKSIIDVSPFHTSFYITNLKSLGVDKIFHHTSEFGTNGMFFAMGKEKKVPFVEKNEVVIQKRMGYGMVAEERFCDGLYFSLALRDFHKFQKNPSLLETPLEKKNEDVD